MSSLSQAKTLGGIGAILTLLWIVPYAGSVLEIVGWILVLLAIKNISDVVQDRSVFNNALIAVILAIVGAAVGGIVIGVNVFRYFSLVNVSALNSTSFSSQTPALISLITGVLAGLAVVWVLGIIASFFLWRSFKTVSSKLKVGTFGTGGLLYFIGSILTIILVGFVLTFVAEIIFAVAFFSLPEEPVPGTVGVTPPPSPAGPSPTMITGSKPVDTR